MYAEGRSTINPCAEFAVKSCPGCGDKLHVMNSDVINLRADDNRDVELCCPVCGSRFKLHKYFSGLIYNTEQYCNIVSLMDTTINKVCIQIDEINRGYGTEYISVASITVKTSGMDVRVIVHINKYKYGDWETCEEHGVYHTTFELYPYEFIYCKDIRDYAAYVQAVANHICNTAMNRMQYKYKSTRLDEDWVAFVRGGDTNTGFNIDRYNKYLERRKEAEVDRKTLYCPDILTGANVIHDGVVYAGDAIQDGLYTVACSIDGIGYAIKETPSQVYLINRY